ncbi:MAG: 2,3-diaminopropionate biosynthesis protein SbnA [Burkholderiaceae bacterium]
MLFKSPTDLVFGDVFLELQDVLPALPIYLKLEGCSITGSIKVKSAIRMMARFELEGKLSPGSRVIESSSGNLGLALSMVCAAKGYSFTCISDPNISPQTAKLIEAYGARLVIVHERDANGGFLGTRIGKIRSLLAADPDLLWVNQYANINNVEAHYLATGPEILRRFPKVDYVFIGAGTTGTLGGVSRYIRQHSPRTRIIAVDSVGSVTFGAAPGKRRIPGLGTSDPPPIRSHSSFDEMIMVNEEETVRMCLRIARKGLLLGGSSGTVLCGVERMADRLRAGDCVVAISPDLGDRYVDTIYDPAWVESAFPGVHAPRDHESGAADAARRSSALAG